MPSRTGRGAEVATHAWRTLRKKVLANATHCAICGGHIDHAIRWPHPASPSVDHIIPRDAGGQVLDESNCQPVHLGCNARAGAVYGNRKRRKQPPSRRW